MVQRYNHDDAEILESIKQLFLYKKIVAEGAGAASAAAVIAGHLPMKGRTVAAVISGGNIDLSYFTGLMTHGV